MQQTSISGNLGPTFRTDDPRQPLEKMSRRELRAFCAGHGIDFSMAMPATSLDPQFPGLVQLIQRCGMTGMEPVPKPKIEPEPAPPDDTLDKLAEKKMPELRKLCKQLGIKQTPKDKKVTLLEKIRGQNLA